ncbi:MAG TPA: reverse transcriptase family protein, partial [Bacillus sp. (in: firmicutes)]|nr:reverse transcriptase family protein [Bacillus sp. (in: firmicutes)]
MPRAKTMGIAVKPSPNSLTDAEQAGFSVIILGDFNLSPSCFLEQQALGLRNPAHFKLIDFLFERNYIDQHPLDEQYKEYATFYSHGSPTSRIDLTWHPDEFIRDDFCFAQVWKLPCSYDLYLLDHNCTITYFTKGLFAAELPKHRRTQKQEWRWFFNVKVATKEEWDNFNGKATQYLDKFENSQNRFSHRSSLNYDHKALNYQWQGLKTALIKAAHDALPKKKLSPYIYQDKSTSNELKHLQLQNSLLNQIYYTVYQFLYETDTSYTKAKQLQYLWTDKKPACRRSCLIEINSQYAGTVGHFDPLEVPYLLAGNTRTQLKDLLENINSLRKLSRTKRSLLEAQHKEEMIKSYANTRCTNFAENKAAFIASSLSRTRRSIVLDRVMSPDSSGQMSLITDPSKIKMIANKHYQTIAGSPPTREFTLQNMTAFWQDIYMPQQNINSNIYDSLLAAPTDDEWQHTISALPNDKAPGPSNISYEMLKKMAPPLSEYLKDIVTLCFNSGHIPSQWKDVTIYPIPKPSDWDCFLKNTRPICLIETARKLMTKIMTNRLAKILNAHKALKGNNYAGLPGGSCHTPIHVLESIVHDSTTNNKPLFIFLQDISKAFDSIDTKMLELAMQRLKIPQTFIKLTLNLFTNRSNRVITANGLSDPYKVKIGIDQGEVISPLLWVIYIDPLLVALNNNNTSPYTISSSSSRPQVDTSTLAFMDDTTLISSSMEGLINMLNIADEFYEMNNTKINFDKAKLISNRDPQDPNKAASLSPSPYQFNLTSSSFLITPIPQRTPFRFLGVWFSLSNSASFVKKQCHMEYQLFANKLSR